MSDFGRVDGRDEKPEEFEQEIDSDEEERNSTKTMTSMIGRNRLLELRKGESYHNTPVDVLASKASLRSELLKRRNHIPKSFTPTPER